MSEEGVREVKQTKRSAAAVAVVPPPRGGRSPSVAIGPCNVWRRRGLGWWSNGFGQKNEVICGRCCGFSGFAIRFWLYLRCCHSVAFMGPARPFTVKTILVFFDCRGNNNSYLQLLGPSITNTIYFRRFFHQSEAPCMCIYSNQF